MLSPTLALPRWEREDKPFHPHGVRRWVPRCCAATLPQSLRGKGWEGGNTVAYYGNVNNRCIPKLRVFLDEARKTGDAMLPALDEFMSTLPRRCGQLSLPRI